jgi:hypothetical protein
MFSFENTPMHYRGVLFGREAFGRVGVDFAWNVDVVNIGKAGPGPGWTAIYRELRRAMER